MSKDSGSTFTARDFELLAGAMSCTKAPIEVDYKKFAEKFSFKNSASAKASWNALKKKLEKMSAGGSVAPSLTITETAETEKPTKGGKKRKTADEDEETEEEGAEAEEAPATKKTKAPPKKKGRKAPIGVARGKGKAVTPVDEDQDDEEEISVGAAKEEKGVKGEAAD